MAERNDENTVIRVHELTRAKINAIRDSKPAWSIQCILDQAMDALLEKLAVPFDQEVVQQSSSPDSSPAS
jgi:hypothetical protein